MDTSSKFYDERYEFDAPQKYIDFTTFREDDDKEDSFFDCPSDSEAKRCMENLVISSKSPSAKQEILHHSGASNTDLMTSVECVVSSAEVATASDQAHCPTSSHDLVVSSADVNTDNDNLHTSSSEPEVEKLAPIESSAVSAEDTPESMDTNDGASDTELEDGASRPVTRSSRKGPLGSDGVFLDPPMRHSPRLAAIAKALATSGGRGPRSSSSGGFKDRRRSVSAGPTLHHSRLAGGTGSLTAEERSHLAQYTTLADQAAATRGRQHEKGSRMPPTRPVAFNFATDLRLKKNTVAVGVTEPYSAADFARTLRSSARSASVCSKSRRGPTKPQPFKLTESKRPDAAADEQAKASKFISLAELNMKFHSQTPQRFRSKPKNEGDFHGWHNNKGGGSCGNVNRAGLTQPQSPCLNTRGRSRPVNHPTREEVEERELQEVMLNKFKSRPLNPKIFEAPKMNPVIPKKLPTVPEPFAIKESKRQQQQAASMGNLLDMMDVSLASIPHGGVPCRTLRANTKPQPFSFDTRDQDMLRKKQEKIQEVIAKEKAMAEFHAHPMPAFDGGPKGLPEKKPPSATKLAPFDLQIDKRAESKKQAMEREKVEREELDRIRREFHARPATVTQKEPFIPARSNKPLTEISGFALNTERRSEQRQEYDMLLKRREEEIMALKRQQEELQAAEEEVRLAEDRKRCVHRARPMPAYPAPHLQPSDRPVTAPISPKFATDSRLRSARSRSAVNTTTDSDSSSSGSSRGGSNQNLTITH